MRDRENQTPISGRGLIIHPTRLTKQTSTAGTTDTRITGRAIVRMQTVVAILAVQAIVTIDTVVTIEPLVTTTATDTLLTIRATLTEGTAG